MKPKILFFLSTLLITLLFSCDEDEKIKSDSINLENWSKRAINLDEQDSLEYGKSYLSIYSQVYGLPKQNTYNMSVLISLRNMSDVDTIYLLRAEYYDTHGQSLKKYFDYPLFLAPLETTEILIDENDTSGGTGSNFIFEWKIPKGCPEPFFEGVMNATATQKGLSFTTQAKRIK